MKEDLLFSSSLFIVDLSRTQKQQLQTVVHRIYLGSCTVSLSTRRGNCTKFK